MRGTLASLAVLACAAGVPAGRDAGPGTRYGIAADLQTYPQGTPREALASVVKAAEARRFDYVAAHLADPGFIDDRVRRLYGGRFGQQVEDSRERLDPATVKLLKRFLTYGTWLTEKDQAVASLKAAPGLRVYLVQGDGRRWYLEHRSGPPPKPKAAPNGPPPDR